MSVHGFNQWSRIEHVPHHELMRGINTRLYR